MLVQACAGLPVLRNVHLAAESLLSDSIDDDQVVVVPITTRSGTAIIVANKNGSRCVRAPKLTSLNLRALAGQGRPESHSYDLSRPKRISFGYLGAYHARRLNRTVWMSTLEETLSTIGKVFWEPLLDQIPKGTKRIVIIPDGALSILPIHAAYSSSRDSVRPILADFAVSYIPSLGCLRLSRAVASTRLENSLCCIVNPEEDQALRWTKLEAEAIRKLFERVSIIEGRKAQRATVLKNAKEFLVRACCISRFLRLEKRPALWPQDVRCPHHS